MSDPIGKAPRSPVVHFAMIELFTWRMLYKLNANRHKVHWSAHSRHYLLARLRQEVQELAAELAKPEVNADAVASECADVANIAAMIADNARRGEL